MRYDETGHSVKIKATAESSVAEDETLAEGLAERELSNFFGSLAAIGAGVVVVVHTDELRKQWRKTFKNAKKAGVIAYEPWVQVDPSVPEGAIQIVDQDDRPPIEDEAAAEDVSEGGVILPGGVTASE